MYRIFFYRDGVKLWLIDFKIGQFGPVFSHSNRREEATLHTSKECEEILPIIKNRYTTSQTEPA